MVLPKLINLLLNGLYTANLELSEYSEVTSFYIYAGFINVLLTYGMETAFFRFYNKSKNKEVVYTTALISLLVSLLLFVGLVVLFRHKVASWTQQSIPVLLMMVGLVAFDILAVIPFAYYRVKGKAINYAGIRIFSLVVVNGFLNFFFFVWVDKYSIPLPDFLKLPNTEAYVFVANFIANAIMIVLVFPNYFRFSWKFDKAIFKEMRKYGAPILVAGLAFLGI